MNTANTPSNLAWHFVGNTLRDGRPVPEDNITLYHFASLPLELCQSGLHFSKHPFDALKHAPGATLCLIRYGGETLHEEDKGVCRERTIVARMDATLLLRHYARMQALSVAHLWDIDDITLEYLITGDESLRSAAWIAARIAAESAGRSAARGAAGSAAWSAAWSAAECAVREDFAALVYEAFEDYL